MGALLDCVVYIRICIQVDKIEEKLQNRKNLKISFLFTGIVPEGIISIGIENQRKLSMLFTINGTATFKLEPSSFIKYRLQPLDFKSRSK